MAQNVSPKGSIIYKILIFFLAAGLIVTILYPKRLWREEEQRTQECRNNMEHILYAELLYLGATNAYTDTLENLTNFIKSDTTGRYLRNYANSDSVLSMNIIDRLSERPQAKTLIDSLKAFSRRMEIDTTEVFIMDSLRTYPEYSKAIDSMAIYSLEHFNNCPTVKRGYHISIIDTSAVKSLTIACPIEPADSLKIINDFWLHTMGGLTITNHGNIKDGEKSWQR